MKIDVDVRAPVQEPRSEGLKRLRARIEARRQLARERLRSDRLTARAVAKRDAR
jgi:hypothetical protein